MSRILVAIDLGELEPSFNFTHQMELSDNVAEHLKGYYENFYLGLMEYAVNPDHCANEVRKKRLTNDFYRSVINENGHVPPKDNVIPLHPPVKKVEGSK